MGSFLTVEPRKNVQTEPELKRDSCHGYHILAAAFLKNLIYSLVLFSVYFV